MTAQKGGPRERDRLLRKFLTKRGKGRRNRQSHVETLQIAEPTAAVIAEPEAVELTVDTAPGGAYVSYAQTQMQAYALQAQEFARLMAEAAQSTQPRS